MFGNLEYKNIKFDFILDEKKLMLYVKEGQEKEFREEFFEVLDNGVYTYKDYQLTEQYLIGKSKENFATVVIIPKSSSANISILSDIVTIDIEYVIYINPNESISRMTFYCKELEYIYNWERAIENRNFKINGEVNIELKSIEETVSNQLSYVFKDKDIKIDFALARSVGNKVVSHPIKINSIMNCYFESTNDYIFIIELYENIKNFIRYLCFRRNINIEDCILYKNNEENNYINIGNLKELNDLNYADRESILKKRYIDYEYIKGTENNILQSLADGELYIRHLPISYSEGLHENEASFIMVTAAFEWEFKKIYKDGIPCSESTIKAKQKAQKNIECLVENSTGKEKKIYKNLLKFISLEGFSENLKYVCNNLDEIIRPFGERLYSLNNEKLNYDEMGERLAMQRNHFAHGDLDKEFIGLSLLDLIFLKEIVYAMQLKRLGISDENIKKCINKLFNAGLAI